MGEQKSFKPSQRKLERAREEGQVLKSQVFTQSMALAGGVLALEWGGGQIWVGFQMLLEWGIGAPDSAIENVIALVKYQLLQALAIFIGGAAVAGVLGEALQVGLGFHPAVLSFKFERLNPISGVRRLGSAALQCWENLVRVIAILLVGGLSLTALAKKLLSVNWQEAGIVVGVASDGVALLMWSLVATMFLLAGMDFVLRRRSFLKDLSMDHHEMLEEHKELEGQPLVKAVRRAMHESLAMQDLERRVRRAKVVLVRRAVSSHP
jgi:flagellar biosynthetic protein FlhB